MTRVNEVTALVCDACGSYYCPTDVTECECGQPLKQARFTRVSDQYEVTTPAELAPMVEAVCRWISTCRQDKDALQARLADAFPDANEFDVIRAVSIAIDLTNGVSHA